MKRNIAALSVSAAILLVGCSSPDAADISSEATTSAAETKAAPTEPTPEATPSQPSGQEYADAVYDAWLANYGATTNVDVLMQLPESVQGYLVTAESPVSGTVVFTAQLTENDVTKAELDQTAMAVLQLVGFTDESLDRVEVVTADSLVRGVANRRDSPLLNM